MTNKISGGLPRFLSAYRSVTGEADFGGLRDRLLGVNGDILSKGILKYGGTGKYLLTGYDYGQFYDWDLYFENIYQSFLGEYRYNFDNLDAFLAAQEEDGWIVRSLGPMGFGASHPFKPFVAQTALLGARQARDYSWVVKNFEKIAKYLESWYTRYDTDGNNLCVWVDSYASGMDNQKSRVVGEMIDEGVDLNSYLYREHKAMALLAGIIGKDPAPFGAKAELIKTAVNEILLTNPSEFWGEYPIRTLSEDSRGYSQSGWEPPSLGCNWNGPTWIPTNYMTFHGLIDYGYGETAKSMAYKTFELVYVKNAATREYYNADTAQGYGRDPFYGWSTLGYFMPLEYELGYDPTSLSADYEILPLARLCFGIDLYGNEG